MRIRVADSEAQRAPCPFCSMPGIFLDREIIERIIEHDCYMFAPKPPLDPTPTDTAFIREARNTQEALARWRAAERRNAPDAYE